MQQRWLFVLALCSAPLGAAEIKVGAPLPRIAMVKEGTHHWLRYVRNGEVNTPVDIWTREVRQAPARYTWKVVGSETIQGPQGAVDCWLLSTDYNRPGTVAKFWLAKATQLLVRQEATAPDGKVMVKSLID